MLSRRLLSILLASALITVSGSALWGLAIKLGAWAYSPEKITGITLFDYVFLEDIVWWFFISFLLSSFWVVSSSQEKENRDVVWEEIKGIGVSFRNAFRGLNFALHQRNFVVELSIALLVVLAGILFQISKSEWLWIILWIAIVLGLEMLNTAIEMLATKYQKERDQNIAALKDVSAGAVLLGSIGSAITGIVIFVPKIIAFL